jgi:hypothetical protein
MAKKLTAKQRQALEWLSKEPWIALWWGGRPHGSWPKQLPLQTYNSLSLAKLISFKLSRFGYCRIVGITQAGRNALCNK